MVVAEQSPLAYSPNVPGEWGLHASLRGLCLPQNLVLKMKVTCAKNQGIDARHHGPVDPSLT